MVCSQSLISSIEQVDGEIEEGRGGIRRNYETKTERYVEEDTMSGIGSSALANWDGSQSQSLAQRRNESRSHSRSQSWGSSLGAGRPSGSSSVVGVVSGSSSSSDGGLASALGPALGSGTGLGAPFSISVSTPHRQATSTSPSPIPNISLFGSPIPNPNSSPLASPNFEPPRPSPHSNLNVSPIPFHQVNEIPTPGTEQRKTALGPPALAIGEHQPYPGVVTSGPKFDFEAQQQLELAPEPLSLAPSSVTEFGSESVSIRLELGDRTRTFASPQPWPPPSATTPNQQQTSQREPQRRTRIFLFHVLAPPFPSDANRASYFKPHPNDLVFGATGGVCGRSTSASQ